LALVAVLWVVAALGILVVGLSQSVRREAGMASTVRQSVFGTAQGEAAIQLAIQQISAMAQRPSGVTYVDVAYQNLQIRVQVTPYTGFIDVNNAAVPLLTRLYAVAGGVSPSAAEALAQLTVEFRSRRDVGGSPIGLEAPEDLLRVPGLGYELYANIAPLIVVLHQGSGKVNPLAAPLEVMTVLANGNVALATGIASQRDRGSVGVDTTTLESAFIDTSQSQRFRLIARVPLTDGAWLLVSRGVYLGGAVQSGLPWRVFQAEQRLEQASNTGD
jgi:general secretion pathway protein K